MRIEIVATEKVFAGTPKQILMQMKSLTPAAQSLSLSAYLDWLVADIGRGNGNQLTVDGDGDDERASSLLAEMLKHGYTRTL